MAKDYLGEVPIKRGEVNRGGSSKALQEKKSWEYKEKRYIIRAGYVSNNQRGKIEKRKELKQG